MHFINSKCIDINNTIIIINKKHFINQSVLNIYETKFAFLF